MAKLVARSQLVDQDAVEVYALLSNDHNPLHVDPDYAVKTAFGGTILHGTIPCAVLLDEAVELGLPYPFTAEFTFVAPAHVGKTLDLVAEEDEGQAYSCTASSNGQSLVIGLVRKEE